MFGVKVVAASLPTPFMSDYQARIDAVNSF